MISSRVVSASDILCRSRNCTWFDPSILRHNGAVLNTVLKNLKNSPL
jgi:hypothetical protein